MVLEFFEIFLNQLTPSEKIVDPLINFFLFHFEFFKDFSENSLFILQKLAEISQAYEAFRLFNSQSINKNSVS